MQKLTLWDWKPSRVNYVLTPLSAQTTKAIIKPIQIYVCSGSTISTENSIQKSIRSFKKVEDSWFIQLWTAIKYDYEINQDLLSKHLKE